MGTVTGFFMTSSGAKNRNVSGNRRGRLASWLNHEGARAIGTADVDIVGVGAAKAAVFRVGLAVAAGAAQRGDVGEPYLHRARVGQVTAVERRLAAEGDLRRHIRTRGDTHQPRSIVIHALGGSWPE